MVIACETRSSVGTGDTLEPRRSALVIVDMINRSCDPGWLSRNDPKREDWLQSELEGMIGGVRKALEGFRGTNGLVVHVTDARWTLDGRECSVLTTLIRGRHMAFERASLLRVYKQVNLDLRFTVYRLARQDAQGRRRIVR